MSSKIEPHLIMHSLSSQQTAHDERDSLMQQAASISLKFAKGHKDPGLTEKLREYESRVMLDSKQYRLKAEGGLKKPANMAPSEPLIN